MTLILSYVSWPFVMQVSDRLVSYRGEPYDDIANKSLIYVAPDGIMAMSYTGFAYVAGVSTDRWIAETLAGRKLREGLGLGGPGNSCLPIGLALSRLKEELPVALADSRTNPACRAMGFELIGVGWRWGKKHRRPVTADIVKQPGASEIVLRHYRLHLPRRRFLVIGRPVVHASPVASRLPDAHLPDQVEDVLVAAIRERSAIVPNEVGKDCMSIVLAPPARRYARVTYRNVTPASIDVVQPSGDVTATVEPAAFSPWIVGSSTCSPLIMAGTFEVHVSGFRIDLIAPPPSGHITSAMSSVTSPPQPPFR